jgi:DNA-binding transcriptional ArsR family regulator
MSRQGVVSRIMTEEKPTISRHLLQVYLSFLATRGWMTSNEVAEASNVAPRTARAHVACLVALGVLDKASVFPGIRYRLSDRAKHRNHAFVRRLEEARSVFGVKEGVE